MKTNNKSEHRKQNLTYNVIKERESGGYQGFNQLKEKYLK